MSIADDGLIDRLAGKDKHSSLVGIDAIICPSR
jgi:hypothetical protein